ncbi:MAG: Rrf2 family transcriptional regulator [Desulfobacteraceae bacterium]|nr:MAG: Rrf2 family transcriptional regulator [Desulfobacteraceae bacterium]
MKLSTRGRYGTRLMVELARNYGKGPTSIAEISRKQDIPIKYLEQLIIPLKRADLVTSVRGPKGGHMLSMSPEQINLWDILVLLESKSSLVDCLVDKNVCSHVDTCPVRPVWGRALQALIGIFRSTTLQDVSDSQLPFKGELHPCHENK